MATNQYPQRRKNKFVAAILAITMGIFGVHKFYLNNSRSGILYIFLFIMSINVFNFPVTFILAFIDAMRLFFMSPEEFNERYNSNVVGTSERGTSERRVRQNVPRQRATRPTAVRTSERTKRRNPFKKSGEKFYEDFNVDGAIKDYNRALEIAPDDGELHFMMAKAYSLNENKEKGFYHLGQAVNLGYANEEKVMTEDDLAFLRIQQEFEEFKNNNYTILPKAFRQKKVEVETDDALLSQLNKLAELRKKGLLSEKEFAVEREKIMRK